MSVIRVCCSTQYVSKRQDAAIIRSVILGVDFVKKNMKFSKTLIFRGRFDSAIRSTRSSVELKSTCSPAVFRVGIQYAPVIWSNVELNSTVPLQCFVLAFSMFLLSGTM